MKKLIVFNDKPDEIPAGFFSLGENQNGDTVFETKSDLSATARLAVADDIVGLSIFNARKRKANKARDLAINAGVEVDGVIFDSSAESSQKVAAVLVLADGDEAFTVNWITKDNNIVELSFSQLKALGMAMFDLTSVEYLKARADKDSIAENILLDFK